MNCFIALCLRSVHSLHSFVRHSFRFIASCCRRTLLRFSASSLLHSVHFTHLSTPHKRSSLLLSPNTYALFRSGIWLIVVNTQLLYGVIYKSNPTHLHQLKRLHFTLCNSAHSFSRFPCLCHRTYESGMLYFFLRLVYPIQRTTADFK